MNDDGNNYIRKKIEISRNLKGGHANYFNWPDKKLKEFHVCEELLKQLNLPYCCLRIGDDPPDCMAKIDGIETGIEVTELVDQNVIESKTNDKSMDFDYVIWDTKRLHGIINPRIKKKDNPKNKDELISRFKKYILILYTDETGLQADVFDRVFAKDELVKVDLITDIYLLFSYDPGTCGCPVRKIF